MKKLNITFANLHYFISIVRISTKEYKLLLEAILRIKYIGSPKGMHGLGTASMYNTSLFNLLFDEVVAPRHNYWFTLSSKGLLILELFNATFTFNDGSDDDRQEIINFMNLL